jgi:single-strand DNA-binding protein
MTGYNHVTLVGSLVADPIDCSTKTNKKSKSIFTIGVERYVNSTKEMEKDYFTVVAMGKLAEVCISYLKAGKKVLVDGRIQVRNDQDPNRKAKWVTEIIAENLKFLTSKPEPENKDKE